MYTVPDPVSARRPLSLASSGSGQITDITYSHASAKTDKRSSVTREGKQVQTGGENSCLILCTAIISFPISGISNGDYTENVSDNSGYVAVVPPKSSTKKHSDHDNAVVLRPGSCNENIHSKKSASYVNVPYLQISRKGHSHGASP